LAQCVLLMAYEWRRAQGQVELARMELAKTQWAEAIEVEKLAQHYEERLEDAGFFFPEAKAPGMKVNLRNMWSRFSLTRADVQMLHGVLRQLVRGNKGQD
jgi:tRNA/rRNA methyltransferase